MVSSFEEIDPALKRSRRPYWDRDLRFLQDKSFAEFVEDMRRNGQQSPALVRPHPTDAGRFEVCYGHRRLFACRSLGTRLRAVVQSLSEAQMAGAAYSENAHREGLSTLEQSRALAKYVDRGVFPTKQALADALNVSRSHVSNLTSYVEIPDRVLEALGDWRKCTFRDANNLLKATRDQSRQTLMLDAAERLIAGDPQLGFHVRLTVLLGQKAAASAETEDLRDDLQGRVVAERKRSKRSTAIADGCRWPRRRVGGFRVDQDAGAYRGIPSPARRPEVGRSRRLQDLGAHHNTGAKWLPVATSGDGFSPSGRSARVSANGLAPAL